jgi:hypothetical protein
MVRGRQKRIALLCLSALLFLQLAVTAYACPTQKGDGSPTVVAVADAQMPCQGMDAERPKLCEQHCVQGSQSVDTQPHTAVNAPVLSLIAVVVHSDLHLLARPGFYGASLATVVDPPPLIRFGVLRI